MTGGGTGLAGVASTAQGEGIHIVNDRKKYKEWEFVYDLKNDKSTGLPQMQQQMQRQVQQQGLGQGIGQAGTGTGTSTQPQQ